MISVYKFKVNLQHHGTLLISTGKNFETKVNGLVNSISSSNTIYYYRCSIIDETIFFVGMSR